MTFFSYISNSYRSMSYQNKLLFSYFIFIMIPLLFLSIFSYRQSSAVITEQTEVIAQMYLEQARTDLNIQLGQMSGLAQQVARQKRIRNILEQDPDKLTISQQFDDLSDLEEIATRLGAPDSIRQIRLYVNDRFLFAKRNLLTYSLADLAGESWFDAQKAAFGGSYLTSPYTFSYLMEQPAEIISAVSLIRSARDYNQTIGVVAVDCNKAELMAILQRIDFSGQGRAYVIDGAANVICGHQSVDGAVLSELEPQDRQHLENSPSADKSLLSAVSGPAAGGWRILVVAPLKPLLANAARLRIQLLVFAVLVGIIVYLLAFLYARSNAGRLLTLVKNMRVVQQGDFNVNCIVDSDDEVGELQSNFNLMVREIRLLLDRQYELGQSLKDSELKVLQAQINPHFLYNTLDLIVWTAANNQPDAVRDIVLKLSRYYRLSLSSGEDFIKISDELEHVRLYVELQNMRFRKKIELITKADPATRDVRILKLLLQPVVENSILHGIQNLDDREGRIEINVEIASQVLQITVADNGIGMEEGELQKIRLREQIKREDPGLGKFGLNNIMQRLYFSYGPQAGLTVDSFPGSGTTVVIRIPITKTY